MYVPFEDEELDDSDFVREDGVEDLLDGMLAVRGNAFIGKVGCSSSDLHCQQ